MDRRKEILDSDEVRELRRQYNVPEEVLATIVRRVVLTESFHSGPLPSPEYLAKYKAIEPSFAERIVQMAEREQLATHEQTRRIGLLHERDQEESRARLDALVKYRFRGQWMGFALAAAGLVCGSILIGMGFPVSGSLLSGGSMASLAAVFVLGRAREHEPVPEPADSGDDDA